MGDLDGNKFDILSIDSHQCSSGFESTSKGQSCCVSCCNGNKDPTFLPGM